MPCPVQALAAQEQPKNKWLVMTTVAVGVFLSTLDGSIVNVALPTLARELHASFAAVQWVVLSYLMTLVALMMTAGRLADVRGKRLLYAAGFAIFTLGSLSCALAPHVVWLVAARVLQAVGASLLMALGAAIVTEAFPPKERGRSMGLVGLMVSLGLVSGPTLGGLILGNFSWQAIFFVNVPLGVLGTLLALRVIPIRALPARQPFDVRGGLLLVVTLLSFLLAVTLGPRTSWMSMPIVGLAVVAALGLCLFVRTELSNPHPLVDLRMFASAHLAVNVTSGAIVFVASSGLVLLLPFFLQDVQGRSPEEAGLLLVTAPLMMGLSAPLSGWLSDRVGTRPLAALGLLFLIFAYTLISGLELNTSGASYVARVAWLGLGMGIFQSPNNSAIMGAVPRDRLGVASGLLSLTRTLGQTTGVALVGALWAALVLAFDPSPSRDAMHAPAGFQLLALKWTARAVSVLLLAALILVVADWRRERHRMGAAVAPDSSAAA